MAPCSTLSSMQFRTLPFFTFVIGGTWAFHRPLVASGWPVIELPYALLLLLGGLGPGVAVVVVFPVGKRGIAARVPSSICVGTAPCRQAGRAAVAASRFVCLSNPAVHRQGMCRWCCVGVGVLGILVSRGTDA